MGRRAIGAAGGGNCGRASRDPGASEEESLRGISSFSPGRFRALCGEEPPYLPPDLRMLLHFGFIWK